MSRRGTDLAIAVQRLLLDASTEIIESTNGAIV